MLLFFSVFLCVLYGGNAFAAAADEVDDFEAVAVRQIGVGPAVARDDVAIALNGDAVGFHAELLDEGGERGDLSEFALRPVDDEFH